MAQHPPVLGEGGAWVLHPNHHKDVLELGPDALGGEGLAAWLLEDNCHNVVPNVSLPQ